MLRYAASVNPEEKQSFAIGMGMEEKLKRSALPILEKIEKRGPGCFVIAIDGRCAAGKTTLAEYLSRLTGAGIVHMDDFFLPADLRSEKRLSEPGGNVHYERFAEEVLPRLQGDAAFAYRRFDCGTMTLGENRQVPAGEIRIVEGAYSHHPYFGNYAALRVFCDIDAAEQLARIGLRDGVEKQKVFAERWIPMEEAYLKAFEIREGADIIV